MNRREQKEERRKQILFTALNLFVTKGYYETKITDIAKAASMSTGLLFHYYESKEAVLVALVQMGADGTKTAMQMSEEGQTPDVFFTEFLKSLFDYSKTQPWVFQMFVLMGQVRRAGMPEEARKITLSLNTIERSSEIIKNGQALGMFREGDSMLLSMCFWTAVQGIMEEMAFDEKMKSPNPEWIMAILRK